MSRDYGQVDIKQWMTNGGKDCEPFIHGTDPVSVLKTMFLLTPSPSMQDTPLMDPATKDEPENTVYFKCSATLLARVILTLERERMNRA